ncbi:MAG: DUF5916 domain-containing protein [Acidobacteriota bacterium]|nr:DUF5916 domain-containing protein [Acidobacteriota bacterium]
MKRAFAVIALVLASVTGLHAQTQPDFSVTRAAQPPIIDGVLNDEVWQREALPLGEWLSYQPNRGDKMPAALRTEVKIAYDDRNIYLAIHSFDHEPAKIRTTISKRDSAFNDDWIAISLDSAGTGQTAYHLFVNPSGVQMDALNTSASGEQFDADVVWYSAGKVVDDGYVVEIRLPLQTLRFSSGDQVRMGLVFFRKISRMGVAYSWPPMPPGQWVFDQPAHLLFANLTQPRLVELLPSVTYGVRQDRETAERWNAADGDVHAGASGKFGITSNITFDGTINPDFSQVESDAFQVEINQRFPIFYSEKRPFFMEGMGLFNIAGTGGPGNMRTAVHTRRISNPFWGTKLTGTSGKTTFGVLNAWDDNPEDIGNRGGAVFERDKLYTIGRATFALRRADYVGAIVTDTEHAGRHNRVIGGDLSIKPSATQQLSATFLASQTGIGSSGDIRGTAAQVSYNYETRRFSIGSQVERYGREFQMDTAFYNRTGFTVGNLYSAVNFYPKQGTNFWLRRVTPSFFGKRGHDDVQDGDEGFARVSLDFSFTRQGHMSVSYGRGFEPWIGRRFETGGANAFIGAQILRWLNVFSYVNSGPEIFYDRVDPFQGHSHSGGFGFGLQPNQHLNQEIFVNMVRFDRASTGERVYSVNIVNAKTTYQFDKHFLVRFLAQYDSSAERVLTDLLASYEFVPGTVFHAGYGSLYEKGSDQIGALRPDDGRAKYLAVNRGLFFKASYLRRF